MASAARAIHDHDPLDDQSLPGWLYHDPEYFALEMARVIRPAWHIVCHLSDLPNAGDWRALALLGESVIVIRGADGEVRAFHNLCRHRGSRLVDGGEGCARKLVCPYHGWAYEPDGRLTGVPERAQYGALDPAALGLLPVELEQWRGFLFVRLDGGGPTVAAMMADHEADVAPYRFEELQPLGRVQLRPRALNWKTLGDNYSDALHIPIGHPGLTRLFGRDGYGIEAGRFVDRMWGDVLPGPSTNASERAYQAMLPPVGHLPADRQRLWLWLKLWPLTAIEIYPDQVGFMQFIPVSATHTLIRDMSYAVPDGRRTMRAARYLNWRINRRVNAEDTALIARVQAGMGSPAYRAGPLGAGEVGLRSFAAKLRHLIPEARLPQPPAPGWSHRPRATA